MKTFNHPQLPMGHVTNGETLEAFLDAGQIKVEFVLQNGAEIEFSKELLYPSVKHNTDYDSRLFVHCEKGFIYWLDQVGCKRVFESIQMEIVFYTDDDGIEDYDYD